MMLISTRLAVACLATVSFYPAHAAVILSNPAYTQDFDSLASTGFSSALPAGWAIAEGGANADANYRAGNGSSNTGDTYSFGAVGSGERALGGLASGNLIPVYGVQFTNNLGSTITALDISYFGELWRAGTANNLNTLSFAYSLDATSLTSGTYIAFSALNYAITPGGSNNSARDGNANRTAINAIISGLNIDQGQSIFLRWTGTNAAGNDHGLAIDDFALNATTVPEVSTWAMLIAGFGMIGAAARRRRTFAVRSH